MKTHTKVIDDVAYTTKTLTATEGLILMPKLVALFGSDLLRLMLGRSNEERAAIMAEPSTMAILLAAIAKNAAVNDGLLVVKELLATTTTEHVRVGDTTVPGRVIDHFDSHFDQRYQHLFEVALWVASCNFLGL